jgi:hypothetical protein
MGPISALLFRANVHPDWLLMGQTCGWPVGGLWVANEFDATASGFDTMSKF